MWFLTAAGTVRAVADQGRALRAVLGERVRRLREEAGLRQQDLADSADTLGATTWNRTRIAALERGDKSISAEELVLLVAILQLTTDRKITLSDLLDSDDVVALTKWGRIAARDVPLLLAGELDAGDRVWLQLPPLSADEVAAKLDRMKELIERFPGAQEQGRTTGAALRAVRESSGEADERAARELGETAASFAFIASAMWGRSLSAERDARLAAAGGDKGPRRTVAARRGRVTRDLIDEVRARLRGGDRDGEHQAEA